LRSGNQDAWRRWTVNRNDVITAHGLDALMDNQLMPTLEVIGERFPKLSSSERQEALVSSSKQYLSENTKLYFLVKDSVDISGAYGLHDMSPIYDNPAKAISAILGFAEVLNLCEKHVHNFDHPSWQLFIEATGGPRP